MKRDPRDLQRYTAAERANHWVVGITFSLLGLSGLALFHPAFWPFTYLFGGGTWTRILHPYVGVAMALSFAGMFLRFWHLNRVTQADREWMSRVGEMMDGEDQDMPEQGKYNGGQKYLFWAMVLCTLLMLASGVAMWRAWWTLPVDLVRLASLLHAATAAVFIALITIHAYAAIWVKGTIRAMWYGTVTRAWARQHHRAWYREATGDKR
jgi:formate dehydrogenase subunit gamma